VIVVVPLVVQGIIAVMEFVRQESVLQDLQELILNLKMRKRMFLMIVFLVWISSLAVLADYAPLRCGGSFCQLDDLGKTLTNDPEPWNYIIYTPSTFPVNLPQTTITDQSGQVKVSGNQFELEYSSSVQLSGGTKALFKFGASVAPLTTGEYTFHTEVDGIPDPLEHTNIIDLIAPTIEPKGTVSDNSNGYIFTEAGAQAGADMIEFREDVVIKAIVEDLDGSTDTTDVISDTEVIAVKAVIKDSGGTEVAGSPFELTDDDGDSTWEKVISDLGLGDYTLELRAYDSLSDPVNDPDGNTGNMNVISGISFSVADTGGPEVIGWVPDSGITVKTDAPVLTFQVESIGSDINCDTAKITIKFTPLEPLLKPMEQRVIENTAGSSPITCALDTSDQEVTDVYLVTSTAPSLLGIDETKGSAEVILDIDDAAGNSVNSNSNTFTVDISPLTIYISDRRSDLLVNDGDTKHFVHDPSYPYDVIKLAFDYQIEDVTNFELQIGGTTMRYTDPPAAPYFDAQLGNAYVFEYELISDLSQSADGQYDLSFDYTDLTQVPGHVDFTFYLDSTAPTGAFLLIENDAIYTNTRDVGLDLGAVDPESGIDEMRIVEDNDDSDGIQWGNSAWVPYQTINSFTLNLGSDGVRRICVDLRNSVRVDLTQAVCDTIILDTAYPAVPTIGVKESDGITDWDEKKWYNRVGVPVSLSVDVDDGAALAQYSYKIVNKDESVVSKDGANNYIQIEGGIVISDLSTLPLNINFDALGIAAGSFGTKVLYVNAKDGAGNWGPTNSFTFDIDREAPAISGWSPTTTSLDSEPIITFDVDGTGSDVDCGSIDIKEGGSLVVEDGSVVLAYSTYWSFDCPTISGVKQAKLSRVRGRPLLLPGETQKAVIVEVDVSDIAGNTLSDEQHSFTIDTTTPPNPTVSLLEVLGAPESVITPATMEREPTGLDYDNYYYINIDVEEVKFEFPVAMLTEITSVTLSTYSLGSNVNLVTGPSNSFSYPLTLTEGTHKFTIKAKRDFIGSYGTEKTWVINIVIDKISPIINEPNNIWKLTDDKGNSDETDDVYGESIKGELITNNRKVKISGSVIEDNLETVRFVPPDLENAYVEVQAQSYIGTLQLTTGDGIKSITIEAEDRAGNVGQAIQQIELDETAPTVSVVMAEESDGVGWVEAEWYNEGPAEVSWEVQADDGTIVTEYKYKVVNGGETIDSIEGGGIVGGTTTTATLLSNPNLGVSGYGTKVFYVQAKDEAGNWGNPVPFTFNIDKTLPAVDESTWFVAENGVIGTDPPPISVTLTDTGSGFDNTLQQTLDAVVSCGGYSYTLPQFNGVLDASGQFSYTPASPLLSGICEGLTEAGVALTLVIQDKAGNSKTITHNIGINTQAPELTSVQLWRDGQGSSSEVVREGDYTINTDDFSYVTLTFNKDISAVSFDFKVGADTYNSADHGDCMVFPGKRYRCSLSSAISRPFDDAKFEFTGIGATSVSGVSGSGGSRTFTLDSGAPSVVQVNDVLKFVDGGYVSVGIDNPRINTNKIRINGTFSNGPLEGTTLADSNSAIVVKDNGNVISSGGVLTISDENLQISSFVIDVNLPNTPGDYSLTIVPKDKAGNIGSEYSIPFTITLDKTSPESTITVPLASDSPYRESNWPSQIQGTADSDTALVEVQVQRALDGYYWNGSVWQTDEIWVVATGTTSWSYSYTPDATGTYTIKSRVTDTAGNVEMVPSEQTVIYDTLPPEVVDGTWRPLGFSKVRDPRISVEIDGTGSDVDCDGITGFVVANIPRTPQCTDEGGDMALISYDAPILIPGTEGTFTVSLTLSDEAGNSNTFTKVFIINTAAPTVKISRSVDDDVADIPLNGIERLFLPPEHSTYSVIKLIFDNAADVNSLTIRKDSIQLPDPITLIYDPDTEPIYVYMLDYNVAEGTPTTFAEGGAWEISVNYNDANDEVHTYSLSFIVDNTPTEISSYAVGKIVDNTYVALTESDGKYETDVRDIRISGGFDAGNINTVNVESDPIGAGYIIGTPTVTIGGTQFTIDLQISPGSGDKVIKLIPTDNGGNIGQTVTITLSYVPLAPIVPILWGLPDYSSEGVVDIIGYTDKSSAVVNVGVFDLATETAVDAKSETIGYPSNLEGQYNVISQYNENTIDVSAETHAAISIDGTDYIEFSNHIGEYFKRYKVVGKSSALLVGFGIIRIEVDRNFEDSISSGEIFYVFDAAYPEGWFNISVGLRENVENRISVYSSYGGEDGQSSFESIIYDSLDVVVSEQLPMHNDVVLNNKTLIRAKVEDILSGVDASSILLEVKGECEFIVDLGEIGFTYSGDYVEFDIMQTNLCAGGEYIEGAYIITLNVSDIAGNKISVPWSFTIDMTPPDVPIVTLPSEGDYVKDSVTVEGTAEVGVEKVIIYLDSSAIARTEIGELVVDAAGQFSGSVDISGYADDDYTLEIEAQFPQGEGFRSDSAAVGITKDTVSYVYSLDSLVSPVGTSQVTVTGSAEAGASVYVYVSDTEYSDSGDCTDSDYGRNYYVKGYVNQVWEDVCLDPVCDEVTGECQPEGQLEEYYCDGNGKADEVIVCENGCSDGACINAGELPVADANGDFSTDVVVEPGLNYIHARAIDAHDNPLSAMSNEITVYYDNEGPVITNMGPTINQNALPVDITADLDDYSTIAAATLTITNDVDAGYSYVHDLLPTEFSDDEITHSYDGLPDNANYHVNLVVEDEFGNTNSADGDFLYDINIPSRPVFNLDGGFVSDLSPTLEFTYTDPVVVTDLNVTNTPDAASDDFTKIFTTDNLDQGFYDIEIQAYKLGGNQAIGTYYFNFTVDVDAPVLTITQKDVIILGNVPVSIDISGTCVDANLAVQDSITIVVEDSQASVTDVVDCTDGTYDLEGALIPLGTDRIHTITVSATDRATNPGSITEPVATGVPELTIVNITGSGITFGQQPYSTDDDEITINGTYMDENFDSIRVLLNGQLIESPDLIIVSVDGPQRTFELSVTLDGTLGQEFVNNITIVVNDSDGFEDREEIIITKDLMGPKVVEFHPVTNVTNTDLPTLSITTHEYAESCSVDYMTYSPKDLYMDNFQTSDHYHFDVTLTANIDHIDDDNLDQFIDITCIDSLDNVNTTRWPLTVDLLDPVIDNFEIEYTGALFASWLSTADEKRYLIRTLYATPRMKLHVDTSEPARCEYTRVEDGVTYLFNNYDTYLESLESFQIDLIDNTDYNLDITCTDRAGRDSLTKRIFVEVNTQLVVDSPVVNYEYPPLFGAVIGSKTVQFNGTLLSLTPAAQIVSGKIGINGINYTLSLTDGRYDEPITFTQDGLYNFTIWAENSEGLVSSVSGTFEIDTTPPIEPGSSIG